MSLYHRLRMYCMAVWTAFIIRFKTVKTKFIHYISGSEALPPPLTNEEEIQLINKLEMGDLSVKSTLIERNLRLVVYIARKFENTGIGVEDLISIGTIGLIKAVNTFNPSKKIKLATMLPAALKMKYLCICGEMEKLSWRSPSMSL